MAFFRMWRRTFALTQPKLIIAIKKEILLKTVLFEPQLYTNVNYTVKIKSMLFIKSICTIYFYDANNLINKTFIR